MKVLILSTRFLYKIMVLSVEVVHYNDWRTIRVVNTSHVFGLVVAEGNRGKMSREVRTAWSRTNAFYQC